MRPGRPFYCSLVLEVEADSDSSWTGPPAVVGRPSCSSTPPSLPLCVSLSSP